MAGTCQPAALRAGGFDLIVVIVVIVVSGEFPFSGRRPRMWARYLESVRRVFMRKAMVLFLACLALWLMPGAAPAGAQAAPTFVGVRTFLSAPYEPNIDKIQADFAVLGRHQIAPGTLPRMDSTSQVTHTTLSVAPSSSHRAFV